MLYLLTPWCRVLLVKLTGLQLVKKFPAFHGTRWFITALTSVRHLSLSWASPIQSIYPSLPPVSILSQPNPVHIPTSHLLEIRPNIIQPSTSKSHQWSPSLRFPHQDPIHPANLTHTRQMPSPSHPVLYQSDIQNKRYRLFKGFLRHLWPEEGSVLE